LAENSRAAMCFFWQPLWEQVLVEGAVEDVSDAEADAYWATRPRLSQLGAWASQQSEALEAREVLEGRLTELERRYADTEVPRPPHWSGYRIVPDFLEFWSARPGRLHDRERYMCQGGGWLRELVNP
jgi:pyridoxamine 5'-phosphate oxidase